MGVTGGSGSRLGAPLTPSRPARGPAAALPVLQHASCLRRLLQPRHETLHVVEHMVQDVLGDRAGDTGDSGMWSPGRSSPQSPQAQSLDILPGQVTPSAAWPCPHIPVTVGHSPRILTGPPPPNKAPLLGAGTHSPQRVPPPGPRPTHSPRPAPPADWPAPDRGGPDPGRPGQGCLWSRSGRASATLPLRGWAPPGSAPGQRSTC